jgi:hypothetical protein
VAVGKLRKQSIQKVIKMKWFGRKKGKAEQSHGNNAAEQTSIKQDGYVDLAALLTDEERRLLVTDLGLIENKTAPESHHIVTAVKELVQEKRAVAVPVIGLCIAAVQNALNTFAAFGMVPSGTSTLLEKLKEAQGEAENKRG